MVTLFSPRRMPYPGFQIVSVRGPYSARVPWSILPEVHREFVHHTVEDDGQEERQDDKREDSQQRK